MSRFNSEAYDKLFPRTPDPVPAPETAAEQFTPTKDKLEGKDPDKEDPDPTPALVDDSDSKDTEVDDNGDGEHC